MIVAADVLTGIDAATKQVWLTQAQNALQNLNIGQRAVTVIVTGGGQHREVTFDKMAIPQLRLWIAELQRSLGLNPRPRRAIAISF
jgi:hypothetical protein